MIARHLLGDAYPIKKLESVVEFLDHKRRPVTESDRKPGPYPYYGANGPQGWIDGFIFDEPLILLAEDGGHFDSPDRGVAYRVTGKTWVNNHAHVLRPTKEVDIGFLCRVLENYDLTPFITGTTRGKLTKAGASEIPVIVPPLEQQRRIAAILDQAETVRCQRRAALAQLDSLTQSIFLEMFGDPVTNDRGWPESLTLGEVADIASGVTKGRSLEGKVTRELPYLAVANVQDKALRLESVKSIEATEDEIRRYRLQKDDLLLTEGGDPDKLGRGTLWENELPECIHQNHIFRVRLTSDVLTPLFLNWLVGSPRGKKYFLRSAKQTTGIASINMTQLRGFPLLVPPLPLQQTFATRIQAIESLKTIHRTALTELDALFASLQQRAFAGEL